MSNSENVVSFLRNQFEFLFRIVQFASKDISTVRNWIINDSSVKAAYVEAATMLLYWNQNISEESRIRVCKESFATVSLAIFFKRNFWLVETVNEQIELFKSSGLIEFWYSRFINKNLLYLKQQNSPKVLELSKLEGCFGILLIGFSFSFSVFLIELLINKIWRQHCRTEN